MIDNFIICKPTKNEQCTRVAVAFCNYNTCMFIFASQLESNKNRYVRKRGVVIVCHDTCLTREWSMFTAHRRR